jgi:hypothetical protein
MEARAALTYWDRARRSRKRSALPGQQPRCLLQGPANVEPIRLARAAFQFRAGPAFGLHWSASTFGHYGVIGTSLSADPQRCISMALLTTKCARHSRDGVLGPVSDLVSQL